MHVGQPEYAAGKGAGERAKAAGVKSFLCVNHYATNPASFERCRGFAEAIGTDYKKSTLDSGDDPTTIESKVAAYLRQNPGHQRRPDARTYVRQSDDQGAREIGSGRQALDGDVRSVRRHQQGNQVRHGEVRDRSAAVLAGIHPGRRAGDDEGDEDHRPEEGRRRREGQSEDEEALRRVRALPYYGPRHISSGPGFVTKENIGKVEKFAGQYR